MPPKKKAAPAKKADPKAAKGKAAPAGKTAEPKEPPKPKSMFTPAAIELLKKNLETTSGNDIKLMACVHDAAVEIEKEMSIMLKAGLTVIAEGDSAKTIDRFVIEEELLKFDLKR